MRAIQEEVIGNEDGSRADVSESESDEKSSKSKK